MREKTAFHDCLEMVDETLYELHKTLEGIKDYPSLKKSTAEHADEVKTLISGAMTNQESCLDGFSHDKTDKKVASYLPAGTNCCLSSCRLAFSLK